MKARFVILSRYKVKKNVKAKQMRQQASISETLPRRYQLIAQLVYPLSHESTSVYYHRAQAHQGKYSAAI